MQAVLIASMGISWTAALFVWTRRQAPGAKQLALMMGMVGWWGFPFLLRGIDHSPATRLLALKLEYVSVVSIAFLWLWFALAYTGKKEWLMPTRLALFALMPCITLILAWTTESHNLIVDFRAVSLAPQGIEYLSWKRGIWGWINTYYQYGVLATGTYVLLRGIGSLHLSYRSQIIPLVITIVVGWGVNILYAVDLIAPRWPIAPLSFAFFGVGISWSLYRHRLLDIVPVARDALIERISDVVLVLDVQQRIIDINPAGQQLLDPAARPPIGQHIESVFPSLGALFQSQMTPPFRTEFKHVDKWGKRRIYDVGVSNLISRQKTVTGYLCVLRDMTELEQFDLAMSGANDGIWDWNLETGTVHFDDRYYTVAGYKPQEFPSSFDAWASRVHPDDIERSQKAVDQCIAARIPQYDIEFRFRRKDTSWMWIRARGKVMERNDAGKPIRFIGTHSDITVRKQAEEALHRFNEELELRVRRRTAELERANRELNEFAYIVSHDLKAPLRGINQLTHWLQEDYAGALGEKGQEQLDLLSDRVKRMDALIDGVLRYSRATRDSECAEPTDLNILVPQVIDTLAPPPHITIRIDHTLPVITGDPVQLTQVFQNLLSNAVKFMDKPDGTITIDCVDSGDAWTFGVKDNGPGIETRHHERIFQIFQSAVPQDNYESTGIGLTVVKKIVEFYGGHIGVESDVGQGTIFTFSLPKQR